MSAPLVTLLVLNYDGRIYLRRLLRSLLAQTYPAVEVLVVDNASPDRSIAIVEDEFDDPRVRVLKLPKNVGFSAGNNAGIRAAHGEYVLMLNNDVELDPRCVEHLVAAAAERGRFGALAPKIRWFHRPEYVESVGTFLTGDGTNFNHGVGHVDVGQFDRPERVFGACFAAAFFRRAVFDEVGLLDESYFMYYEDVDWCWRANRLGFPTWTVPAAVVRHVHSGTLRHTGAARKHYFLARNHLRFALQNLPGARWQLLRWAKTLTPLRYWRVWLKPRDVLMRLRVGGYVGVRLPVLLARRWQRRHDPRLAVSDAELLGLSRHRESFFVSDEMYPEPSFRAVVATMRELLRAAPSPENVVRLGQALAFRHLLGWQPTAAVARALYDAWAETLRDLPNHAELVRLAGTIPALRAALRGLPPPILRWPRKVHERVLRATAFRPAAFVLGAAFAANGDRTALRALGVALANWEYRRRIRGTVGAPEAEIEAALGAAWRAARGALTVSDRDTAEALARADRAFRFRPAPATASAADVPPRAAAIGRTAG